MTRSHLSATFALWTLQQQSSEGCYYLCGGSCTDVASPSAWVAAVCISGWGRNPTDSWENLSKITWSWTEKLLRIGTGPGCQNLYLKQVEVNTAKATTIVTGCCPPPMCGKGLPECGMGLTVMMNEILPPKIMNYFTFLLTFTFLWRALIGRLKGRSSKLWKRSQPKCQKQRGQLASWRWSWRTLAEMARELGTR